MSKKNEENAGIGLRIKAAREGAGYTQERLAELVDVTAQYISGVERGVVGLSVSVLMRICTVLQISCDTILMGKTTESDLSELMSRLNRLPTEHIKNIEALLGRYLEGIAIEQSRCWHQPTE